MNIELYRVGTSLVVQQIDKTMGLIGASVEIHFAPRDLRFGLFWQRRLTGGGALESRIYIQAIPLFPISLTLIFYVEPEDWIHNDNGHAIQSKT